MQQAPNDQQLALDWLDALSVLKAAGLGAHVPRLYRDTEIAWADKWLLPVARIEYKENDSVAIVAVETGIADLPKVERIEVLCYIAAAVFCHFQGFSAAQLAGCCKMLGCANTARSTIRERWRLIAVESKSQYDDSLLATMFEDRTACGWCKGPLVTGSVNPVNKRVHEGCLQYLTDVIAPQQREALARERQAYTAQVDK